MSAKLLGIVWELDLPEHTQAVLLALCDHAKPDGSDCYPSVGRVAWMTGKSERQVQRIMSELRDARILVLVRKGGGRGRPAKYRIDLDVAPRKAPYVPGKGDTDDTVCNPDEFAKGDTGDGVSENGKGDAGDVVSGARPPAERVTPRARKGDTRGPERVTPTSPEPTENQQQPRATEPRDAARSRAPEGEQLQLVEQQIPWNGGVLFDAWIKRRPQLKLSPQQRAKHGAAAKRLAEQHTREDVLIAWRGIEKIAPFCLGQPWDLMDLDRRWANAYEAGLVEVQKPQTEAAEIDQLAQHLERRRNGRT